MLQTIGSGGSCSSLEHGPVSPLQQQHLQQHSQQQLEAQGSSPHALYAASSRAATPASRRISGTGSNSSFAGPTSGSAISSTDILMRQGSNMSASARSGSATPRSAAAAAAAAASQLAPTGSNAEQEHQQQQQQQQAAQWQTTGAVAAAAATAAAAKVGVASSPLSSTTGLSNASSPLGSDSAVPAVSGPSGGPPPGSLSGWLGGDTSLQKRQQVQQQVLHKLSHQDQTLSPRQQQQQHQQSIPEKHPLQQQQMVEHDRQPADQQMAQSYLNLELSPQVQQQQLLQQQPRRQPRMSCPNPGELLADIRGAPQHPGQQQGLSTGVPLPLEPGLTTASHSAGDLATGWAYPSVSADIRRPASRTSLAQEQLAGLKAIWDLKAKLQIKPDATGSPGSGPLLRDFLQQQQQQQQGMFAGNGVQQQQMQGGPYWAIAESHSDAAMHI